MVAVVVVRVKFESQFTVVPSVVASPGCSSHQEAQCGPTSAITYLIYCLLFYPPRYYHRTRPSVFNNTAVAKDRVNLIPSRNVLCDTSFKFPLSSVLVIPE